jgi:hypothetical protein
VDGTYDQTYAKYFGEPAAERRLEAPTHLRGR